MPPLAGARAGSDAIGAAVLRFLVYFVAMSLRAVLLVLALLSTGPGAQGVAFSFGADHPEQEPASKAGASSSTSPGADEISAPKRAAGDEDSTACSAINPVPPQEKAVTLKKITKGMLIHKVEPSYPSAAKRAHIEGTVILCANIGKNGKITFLQVASGPPELVPAAMKAVKKWRYKPYLIDDEPVELHTTVTVSFALAK